MQKGEGKRQLTGHGHQLEGCVKTCVNGDVVSLQWPTISTIQTLGPNSSVNNFRAEHSRHLVMMQVYWINWKSKSVISFIRALCQLLPSTFITLNANWGQKSDKISLKGLQVQSLFDGDRRLTSTGWNKQAVIVTENPKPSPSSSPSSSASTCWMVCTN